MVSFVRTPLRIAIIAGEASGDLLGADLLKILKYEEIPFSVQGIAGPEMQKQGARSLFPIEKLSVMGIGEILKQLFQLLILRNKVKQYFISKPPHVFIGIDAPEFNLGLERSLKRYNIPIVHYVSPSVWAWRPWRLKKIKKSVHLMLCLFPFEKDFYRKCNIPAVYVGHPFANEIPFLTDTSAARKSLGLPESSQIVALLPGSRSNEIHYLGRLFIETAESYYQKNTHTVFITAMVNETIERQFKQLLQTMAPSFPLYIIRGNSRQVIAASDVVLLASGTATLEGMLLKKPMVVAYRMSTLSYYLAKILVKVDYISLPNLLANKPLVSEFIQHQASVSNLTKALQYYLENPSSVRELQKEFLRLHRQLRCNPKKAIKAILELLSTRDKVEFTLN